MRLLIIGTVISYRALCSCGYVDVLRFCNLSVIRYTTGLAFYNTLLVVWVCRCGVSSPAIISPQSSYCTAVLNWQGRDGGLAMLGLNFYDPPSTGRTDLNICRIFFARKF